MLLRYFRNALITLSLATLLAGAAMGQVMTRVTGEIIGADGNPVEGAEIRIVRTDIRGNYSLKTDDKGKFLHATLPRGTYNIDVVIDGEVAVSVTDIQTNPNEAFPLNIDMREILKQQQAGIAPEAELSEADRLEMERRLKEAEEAAARDKALQDAFNVGM